jgi:hypothetical protein
VQSDEMHSRPQRFTYGPAPYASSVVMNQSPPYQILAFTHADDEKMKKTTEVTKAGLSCSPFLLLIAHFEARQSKAKQS